MAHTATEHSTTPRLAIVSSEVHYWVTIEKNAIESPNILKTLGSQEYSTEYASIFRPLESELQSLTEISSDRSIIVTYRKRPGLESRISLSKLTAAVYARREASKDGRV